MRRRGIAHHPATSGCATRWTWHGHGPPEGDGPLASMTRRNPWRGVIRGRSHLSYSDRPEPVQRYLSGSSRPQTDSRCSSTPSAGAECSSHTAHRRARLSLLPIARAPAVEPRSCEWSAWPPQRSLGVKARVGPPMPPRAAPSLRRTRAAADAASYLQSWPGSTPSARGDADGGGSTPARYNDTNYISSTPGQHAAGRRGGDRRDLRAPSPTTPDFNRGPATMVDF